MRLRPYMLKWILNLYPPYLGAGVKVEHIDSNWKCVRVSMRLRWYNRNIVSTHFGGSLYSMVDPHLMLLLMNLLGPNYIVWDKQATIDFIKPGKGKVHADLQISDQELQTILQNTERRKRDLPQFTIKIMDEKDTLIATVQKILYVRKKRFSDS